jgi:hypothetical protein
MTLTVPSAGVTGGAAVTDLEPGTSVPEGEGRRLAEALAAVEAILCPPADGPTIAATPPAEAGPNGDTSRALAGAHDEAQPQDEPLPAEPHMDLLESAWGVIANAGWDESAKSPGWQEAAVRWRDDYHRWLDLHLRPGGYQTWEELATGVTRERDALFAEVSELRRAAGDFKALAPEASIVLCPTCLHDGVLERTLDRAATAEARLLECMEQATAHRERAEAAEARCAALESTAQAEAKLAAVRTVLLEGGQDAGTARRRALAVIGTEEERPVVYAALDRAVERMRAAEGEILALRSQLASAQNAIGQLIRWSQSVLMEEGRAERKRFARWLLGELAPWTGQERSEEGERHG